MNKKRDVILTTENALSEWRNSKALAEALSQGALSNRFTTEQEAALFHFYKAVKLALKPCAVGPIFYRKSKLKELSVRTGLNLTTDDGDTFFCKGFNYPLSFLINLNFGGNAPHGTADVQHSGTP